MALKLITPPTAEPVDLVEVKAHTRVDINDDDVLARKILGAARGYCEGYLNKQLVAARYKQTMDGFPPIIELQTHPLIQVVSIQYIDMAGNTQTVDPTTYTVDDSTEPVRIAPVFGQIWPIPRPQIGAVWVTLDAGYAAPITADASADTITVSGWKALNVGDVVRLSNSGGSLPAPLREMTDYYIQSVPSAGVYKLALTSGGSAIDLSDVGSGTNFLGIIPEGVTGWLKIRLSTLYENREEVAILTRGKIDPLPYVDRLLDGYKIFGF